MENFTEFKMKSLINDKEIAKFLLESIDYHKVLKQSDITLESKNVSNFKREFYQRYKKRKVKFDKENRKKLLKKINKSVSLDLKAYTDKIKEYLYLEKEKNFRRIHKNLEYLIKKIGKEKILLAYKHSHIDNFVKNTGASIDHKTVLIRRKDYDNLKEDCLLRNMMGNEEMLLAKIDHGWPFWFIDTGYTNFLDGKKKIWHRLVRNNLHHSKAFEAPVDRLGNFESFPIQWRESGEKILVIEPGGFSARTYKIEIDQWKKSIESELRKYTDKPIIFREKFNKKVRSNLYKELLNDDYYCVVNINSNAAIEAIWAGVPTITLHTHITNSVSRNKISDINNLYKPHLSNWLCMLSYSQFTYEELINGTAIRLFRKYHA